MGWASEVGHVDPEDEKMINEIAREAKHQADEATDPELIYWKEV